MLRRAFRDPASEQQRWAEIDAQVAPLFEYWVDVFLAGATPWPEDRPKILVLGDLGPADDEGRSGNHPDDSPSLAL
jgi:hypothetical protein